MRLAPISGLLATRVDASFSDAFRTIQSRVNDEIQETSEEYEQITVNFSLTSIYDHSLHESFSKVLQKLMDTMPAYEELINVFCAVSIAPHCCTPLA